MNTQPFSIIYTFFRSLSLHHLEKSLFSLSQQTVQPDDFVLYDNNTSFSPEEIQKVIALHFDPSKLRIIHDKHGNNLQGAAYCHNLAIPMAKHDTFILCRGDLIYDPTYSHRVLAAYAGDPMNYAACWLYQMPFYSKLPYDKVDYATELEVLNWRQDVRNLLKNSDGAVEHKGPEMDSASFCMSKKTFHMAGKYDEYLTGWSLFQMNFQWELRKRGVQFQIVPEFLYYHFLHPLPPEEGERDIRKAHAQAAASPRRKMKEFQ